MSTEPDELEVLRRYLPELFAPQPEPRRMLYVGANRLRAPHHARTLRAAGWRLHLLEIFPDNVQRHRKSGPFDRVMVGDVRNADLPQDGYDAVFWWHGPEHIERGDLESTLKQLEAAAPLVVLGCPDGPSPQGPVYGNDAERHRWSVQGVDLARWGYSVKAYQPAGRRHLVAWKERRTDTKPLRILLGLAQYPTEPHIRPETAAALDALNPGPHAVTVMALGDDDPALDPKDNLVVKHNKMRARVLAEGFDALFTVEADMVVPPDALVKLAAVDADVVYGAYISRHHPMVVCFPSIDGFNGRSISADPERWRGKFGQVIPSEGAGFGCTLIHRRVLEAVEFRRRTDTRREQLFADDWTWALDAKAAGFRSAHHLGVYCGHSLHDGRILWPDVSAPNFVRIEGEDMAATKQSADEELVTVRMTRPGVWSNSQERYLAVGEEFTLYGADAELLIPRFAVRVSSKPLVQAPAAAEAEKEAAVKQEAGSRDAGEKDSEDRVQEADKAPARPASASKGVVSTTTTSKKGK